MALTQVTSIGLKDGEIVNADLHSAASVALSKLASTGALGSAVTATTQSASDDSTKLATTAFVQAAVTSLIDGAPGSLNTLNELAAAINDDSSYATTLTTALATKLPLAGGTLTGTLTIGNGSITTGSNFSLNGNALTVTGTSGTVIEGKRAGSATIQATNTTNSTDLQLRADATGGLVRTASNKPLLFGTNQLERMRIDTSGKIGIGEDAPQQKLHLHEASSNGNFIVFTNSTTGATGSDGCLFGINSDEGGTIWNQENGYIRFGTNDTERLKITSVGRTLIGAGAIDAPKCSVGGLDIASGLLSLIIGGEANTGDGTPRTNSVTKEARIAVPHYTLAEEPTAAIVVFNQSGDNYLRLGGGTSLCNACSDFAVYTAANTTTTSGTQRFHINENGHARFGTGTATYQLEVRDSGAVELLVGSSDGGGATIILDGDGNGDGSGADYAQIWHDSSGNLNYRARGASSTATAHSFYTNTTKRLSISAVGNVTANHNGLKYQTDSSGWYQQMQGGATNPGGTIRFSGGNADGDLRFYAQGQTSTLAERLRITASGVIQTGSKTITGGNNLAIQNFAVKGVWSGSPSIGKSIELISGYDSAVKMAAIGYNLTDTNTGSTYGGDLTFHTQPLYSSPTTPVPVSMRISSSGYVTKPKTPYFHVQASPSISNTPFDNGVKSFGNIRSNNGSHYDNSTGVFTVPVAGFYFFSAGLWSGNGDANDGNNYALLIRRGSSGGGEVQFAGANHHDNYGQLTMAAGYYCDKGDQIYAFYNGSLRGSTPRNYFSGCLLG